MNSKDNSIQDDIIDVEFDTYDDGSLVYPINIIIYKD